MQQFFTAYCIPKTANFVEYRRNSGDTNMSAIIILILASLIVATGFLLAFLWAVKSGQFEDKVTPSMRMLWDDKKKKNINDTENSHK